MEFDNNKLRSNAIEFFEEECKQYQTLLSGVLADKYRDYIMMKMSYYTVAIEALYEQIEKTSRENYDKNNR